MPQAAQSRRVAPALARVLSITNQKGGVGKTTTAAILAEMLALLGKRVLGIDADPQASFTILSGLDPTALERDPAAVTLYHRYKRYIDENRRITPVSEGVYTIPIAGRTDLSYDLVPASLALAGAEANLLSVQLREWVLRKLLAEARMHYDYIIIDCSPNLAMLTINALAAAQRVLIPVEPEFLSVQALAQLIMTIAETRTGGVNEELQVLGALVTKVPARSTESRLMIQTIQETFASISAEFGPIPILAEIPDTRRFSTASRQGISLIEYLDARGKNDAVVRAAALAYQRLAQIIDTYWEGVPEGVTASTAMPVEVAHA